MAPNAKDVEQELEYQAQHAGGDVQATAAETIRRYRALKRRRTNRSEYVFAVIAKVNPKHVCDFGCGDGEVASELGVMGYRVTGFDLSPELIAIARRRAQLDGCEGNVRFLVANAEDPGLPREGFDLLLVKSVLHHVDVEKCLLTAHALLEPGGVAIIHEPVAFSRALQRLRDRTPVVKDISPNERQLDRPDLSLIESHFDVVERHYFHLFTRLERLLRQPWGRLAEAVHRALEWADYLTLTALPFMRRYAGIVVLTARKRA